MTCLECFTCTGCRSYIVHVCGPTAHPLQKKSKVSSFQLFHAKLVSVDLISRWLPVADILWAASQERVPHLPLVLRNILAPRMSSVNVKGLRQTEESYSVLFTPVATLPISMKISSGNYTKCVPWSEIPGPNITVLKSSRSIINLEQFIHILCIHQFENMLHFLAGSVLALPRDLAV